jgi:hypothetical protein
MAPSVIAQRGPVAVYEIKTANVTLYWVKCAGCGRTTTRRVSRPVMTSVPGGCVSAPASFTIQAGRLVSDEDNVGLEHRLDGALKPIALALQLNSDRVRRNRPSEGVFPFARAV